MSQNKGPPSTHDHHGHAHHDHDHDHDSHDHGHAHSHEHAHAHGHGHGHGHGIGAHAHARSAAPRAIIGAMVVTLIFMAVELIAGWIANSLALISDGAHMLTDVGAMLLSLFAIWIARKPTSTTMSFGYHRAEILGALASGLAIWAIAGGLVYEAISRFNSPPEVQGKMVFVVASIGLLANLLSMKLLHGVSGHNINARAAYLHLLTDALGSIGAIVAGLVLWLTGWRLIDPIITVFFALLMLVGSWKLLKEAVEVLMESVPAWIDLEEVKSALLAIPHVTEVHDLHIWTVTIGRLALSVHLISRDPEPFKVLSAANAVLKERFGIVHTTIQVEHPEHFRHEGCYDCAIPASKSLPTT